MKDIVSLVMITRQITIINNINYFYAIYLGRKSTATRLLWY